MGRNVNLAARLAGCAAPGQILAGESTYRLARYVFEFAAVSINTTGTDHPLDAYDVKALLPETRKARGIEGLKSELIGRRDELAELRSDDFHPQFVRLFDRLFDRLGPRVESKIEG